MYFTNFTNLSQDVTALWYDIVNPSDVFSEVYVVFEKEVYVVFEKTQPACSYYPPDDQVVFYDIKIQ